jgi:tetratricopeptide (TPR) repeat protein
MADPTLESPEQAVQKWLRGEISAQELFALNSETIQALADHGYMLYENGKYQKAAVVFEALSAFDNVNPNYHKMLGSIYQLQGRYDASYYRYTLAVKSQPSDIPLLVNRGEVLLKLGRNKEGMEDLKNAILLDRDNMDPASKRARILLSSL